MIVRVLMIAVLYIVGVPLTIFACMWLMQTIKYWVAS